MTPKPDVLNLLEKLQNFTPNEVDEERGSFNIGDSVIYNLLGGALSNSDLIRTLGVNEHTLRVRHNGAVAKIIETAGEEVSRYDIVFEDGFTIKDVATSELKAAEPSGTQPEPREKPDLNAEELHLEDYSDDDLEKVKSKSAETGDAIRKVKDDELKIAPDKTKKESKVNEDVKKGDRVEILRGSQKGKTGIVIDLASPEEYPPHGQLDVKVEGKVVYLDWDDVHTLKNEEATEKVIREEKCPKCDSKNFAESNEAGDYACADCGYDESIDESKLKEVKDVIVQIIGGEDEGKAGLVSKWVKGLGYQDVGFEGKTKQISYEFLRVAGKPAVEFDKEVEVEESKVEEEETEITPSRAEFKKIGDEQLKKLYRNVCRSHDYYKKDKTQPEKVGACAKAMKQYEEELIARGLIDEPSVNEKKESKFSFMKKQEPLWLCNECYKTFRNVEAICVLCESKEVERILEQAKEVFQVTWKNTDTGKEESTRVMAYDETDAKREAKRSNREIIKAEGPITEEPKKEETKVPFDENLGTEPYTITWQNLDEPHGKFRFFDVDAHSKEHAEAKAIDTLKRDGIPEKFIEIKAAELKEREQKVVEDEPITAIEIVTSKVDPDAYNIRVVQLPEGSIVILDSVSDREVAIERGKKFARDLNAKFLGIIDEKKVEEQEGNKCSKCDCEILVNRGDYLRCWDCGTTFDLDGKEIEVEESNLKEQEEGEFQKGYAYAQLTKEAHLNLKTVLDLIEPHSSEEFRRGYVDYLEKFSEKESKLKEQEEDTFKTFAKGIEDKETADKLAAENEGQVVVDDEDDKKFAVLVKEE